MFYSSLLHGLCNPRQRLVCCVKRNLLSFEYQRRMILSVLLLKMSCYLHLMPAVFWKIAPVQGHQQAGQIRRNLTKFNRKCKALHLEKNNPTHHYKLGDNEQESILAERALGTGWMLCWTWASSVPVLQGRLTVFWIASRWPLPFSQQWWSTAECCVLLWAPQY